MPLKAYGAIYPMKFGQERQLLVPQLIQASHDSYIEANRRSGINKIVGNEAVTC